MFLCKKRVSLDTPIAYDKHWSFGNDYMIKAFFPRENVDMETL